MSSVTSQRILFRTVRCIHAILLVLLDMLQQLVQIVVDLTVIVVHSAPVIWYFQLGRLQVYTGKETILIDRFPVTGCSRFAGYWTYNSIQ